MDAANPTSGLPWSVSTRGSASGSSGKGLSKGLKGRKCLERWRAQEERWGRLEGVTYEAGGTAWRGGGRCLPFIYDKSLPRFREYAVPARLSCGGSVAGVERRGRDPVWRGSVAGCSQG